MSNFGMRFGFVAVSLSAHLAVVGLAWRFAPEGLPPVRSKPTPSGLQASEVELAPWAPESPPERPDPAAQSESESNADLAVQEREAPVESVPPPRARNAAPSVAPAARRVAKPAPPSEPRAPAEPRPAEAAPQDWLSLDQQLPDPAPGSAQKAAQKPAPRRDELVERLLAKERDRARLAARDEAARDQAARTEAAREASATARTDAVQNKATPSAKAEHPATSVSPTEEAWGESRAQADVWVELTRWLPRAASNDPAWERLPAGSHYDFRVELTTESGRIVATKVSSGAPAAADKLLVNTSHLMARGRYGGARRQVHRFELRVRLSTTTGRDLWIAHTTPDPPKPGVGSFIAPSGRRFDVWVSSSD